MWQRPDSNLCSLAPEPLLLNHYPLVTFWYTSAAGPCIPVLQLEFQGAGTVQRLSGLVASKSFHALLDPTLLSHAVSCALHSMPGHETDETLERRGVE